MSIEAMKQALEAMGLMGADLICEAAHHGKKDRHGIGEPCHIQQRWHKAFDALRTAIAEAEKSNIKQVIHLYDKPPVAPVQESESFEQWNAKQHGDPEEIGLLQALRIAYCAGQDSVSKATPPAAQRQWVGFTEEEINEYDYEHRDFIYDIEALLKHKNTRLG